MGQPDAIPQRTYKISNPAVEPLRQGFRMDLPDLIGVLYGSADKEGADAQHVILGAVHSHDNGVYDELARNDVVRALAENAVKNVFLELPKGRQRIVNEFLGAAKCAVSEGDYQAFAKDFREGEYDKPYMDKDDWGLKGSYETVEVNGQMQTVFNGQTLEFINDHVAPFMVKAKCGDIKTYLADDIARGASEYWAYKEAHDSGNRDAYIKLGQDYLLECHDDKPYASFIEDIAGDDKSLVLTGALHGSLASDLDELLENNSDKQRCVVKMDIAQSYKEYARDLGSELSNVRDYVREFGEDPPDIVYLIDEKLCLTTKNTPQYVVDALEKNGIKSVPVEKLFGQNTVDEQTLVAQENKGLLSSAFA